MNKNILITLKKELRSIFRDQKTIRRMFLFPLIIPIMVILYGTLYDSMDTYKTTYQIGTNIAISETEKEIASALNIEYQKYNNEKELKKAYEEDKIEGYLIYKDNNYTIYTNQSTTSGMTVSSLLNEYLDNYNAYLTNEYLKNEGIDLNKAYNHFTYEFQDLSKTNYLVQIILLVSVTYIIMSICLSTSNMATMTTATEKENGTLETILTFPIKRNELIIGKYLSSAIIGFITSLIGLILMMISLYYAKETYSIFNTLNLSINISTIIISILIIFLASILIASIALILTCYSKTYKEAQSACQFLNIISIIPMFVGLVELKINYLYYLIPICNYEQIILDIFTNNLNYINVILTILSTFIFIIVVLTIVIKAYNSEKILFQD